ncbi:MAG: ArnT family glycosyltransferase, partial [Nitrosopumilaceae archaeon]
MLLMEQFNKITLTHVLLLSLVLHTFVIAQPQSLQVWDESIFLEIARDFMAGNDRTPYQLPGLNFFIGPAMYIFGDNWFSWRMPLVIFGILTLWIFYKICCRFTSERNALFATIILSFDSIFFVHSTLILRDMPLIFFGMLSFYLYLRKRYYLSASILGFAFMIKETAIFFFVLTAIYHLGVTKPWKGNIK